ncbi:MAG: DUF4296 domain-containing protein [Chryseolinea sp.]
MSIFPSQIKYEVTKCIKRLLVHFGAILLLVCTFQQCSRGERPPKDLLSKEEMVKTLTEIYLIEQRVNSLGFKRDSLNQVFVAMKERAFASAGTSDSTFRRSFDYYAKTPKEIDEIYSALIDTLNLHEQRLISNQVKK